MLTRAAEHVADHAKRLVKLEVELAKLELKKKLGALGAGVGMLVGGAIFALFALGFLLAAAAAGLATAVSTWLALLLVGVVLLLLTGALVFLGLGSLKKGAPPVPERALEEARLTTEVFKNGGG
jgi:hypothetical protein